MRTTGWAVAIAAALAACGHGGAVGDEGAVLGSAADEAAPVAAEGALGRRVEEALAEGGIDSQTVVVDVEGRSVHLSGWVQAAGDVERSRDAALSVPGVTHVFVHELQVG